jgi:exodeoxyribonuclease VII large subunit
MTVGQLVRLATGALERGVGVVWVEGETAQVARPASGHLYFQLRDRGAVIPAVMWRSDAARLRFRLEPGVAVRVRGRLGIYERDGRFQLYVDFAEPAGLGAEALALAQLRDRLAAEGLFAEARKRPLPHLPARIGVVTSASGAAVRDVIRAVHRRFPRPILIADCAVQGAEAPRQLVYALRAIVRAGVDLVIVGRGGGSAGDLAAFNDERVVRAVAACPVPVISAVGHEIDLTLCDLAADRRASTPTMAGEMAVPVREELQAALRKEERRLARELELVLRGARQELDQLAEAARAGAERRLARQRAQLAPLAQRLAGQHPRARLHQQRAVLGVLERRLAAVHPVQRLDRGRHALAALEQRLHAAWARRGQRAGVALADAAARLDALSPLRVLDRGYAVASRDGRVITEGRALAAGDEVAVRLARGGFRARVTETSDGAVPAVRRGALEAGEPGDPG